MLSPMENIRPVPNPDIYAPNHIDPELCIGCSLCQRACLVNAISGELRSPYRISEDQCIGCGLCAARCKKNAISYEGRAYSPTAAVHRSRSLYQL